MIIRFHSNLLHSSDLEKTAEFYKKLGFDIRRKDDTALQDDLYRIATEEYKNFQGKIQPSGFFFISYLMPGMEIKNRPAEVILRNFFTNL